VSDYGYRQVLPTRWHDNDIYGHVNNTIYYAAMDTTINTWMMRSAGFDPHSASAIGLCVSSSCEYRASAAFPDTLVVGLRVGRLGRTSITWETGIFRAADDDGDELLLATGTFVHVFVDRDSRRPVPIPEEIRTRAEQDLVR
jgi:acyl-CoA thioester hydrolase